MHDMYTHIVLLKYKTNNKDWDVAAISACIMPVSYTHLTLPTTILV